MPIKGFHGISLLDYPGKIASIIFLGGCNFRCPFCQNPDLVEPARLRALPDLRWGEVLEALEERVGFIDGVVVTGGEPTIHQELPLLLRALKGLGLAVKLDTNGYSPGLLGEVLSAGLVDFVAMDIKATLPGYRRAAGMEVDTRRIEESVSLLMGNGVEYEFRTTCVPGLVSQRDMEAIASWLRGARQYCLQQFRPQVVLDDSYRLIRPFPAETLDHMAEVLALRMGKVLVRGLA